MNVRESHSYLLATYIDGPYFKSALEILLYPIGCSFYRPYSYRIDWVATNILSSPQMESENATGFIGIRFMDKAGDGTRPLFIPLRKLDYISYKASDGYHVRFRLGDYICHKDHNRFITCDLSQKLSEEYGNNNDLLFSRITEPLMGDLNRLTTSKNLPTDIWDNFLKDPNLIHEAAKNITGVSVLQLLSITQRGKHKVIEASELEDTNQDKISLWGYKFEVGKIYDIDLIQRIIAPKGSNLEFGKVSFLSTASDNRIRLSRIQIPQTGNYREEKLWMQPLRREPAPVFLEWEPKYDHEHIISESVPKNSVPLRIPFIVKPITFFKFRPILLCFGIFFWLATVMFFSFAVTAEKYPNWIDSTFWIALGGICAPLGAGTLIKWFDEWTKYRE